MFAANVARLAAFFVFGFVVLLVALAYWQVIRFADVGGSPSDPRTVIAAQETQRGTIVDRNGVVLAQNLPAQNNARVYTQESLASVIGYASARYGRADLEAAFNPYLNGDIGDYPWSSTLTQLLHHPTVGDTLTLTIDVRLQTTAAQLLGSSNGAIIVLQPRTGAVLAMVSKPWFNPNLLDQNWPALSTDPQRSLLNRATQALYPPGSTFKLVTAAAALQSGLDTPATQYTCIGDWVVQGFHISCENPQIPEVLTFQRALELSANGVFAQVAGQLGSDTLSQYATLFGFGDAPSFGLPVTPSRIKNPNDAWSPVLLASSGFGQGEILVTPLQMALVVDAVANGGVMMQPYLVAKATSPDGTIVYEQSSRPWRTAITAQTAATLTTMMVGVVNEGSGSAARIPQISVAAKTGTAQVSTGANPHAWFVAFAPADQPTVEVVVLIENGGEGATVAGPIAAQLLQQALKLND